MDSIVRKGKCVWSEQDEEVGEVVVMIVVQEH